MKLLVWLYTNPSYKMPTAFFALCCIIVVLLLPGAPFLVWLIFLSAYGASALYVQLLLSGETVARHAFRHELAEGGSPASLIEKILAKPHFFDESNNRFKELVRSVIADKSSDEAHAACLRAYLAINDRAGELAIKAKDGAISAAEGRMCSALCELNTELFKSVKERKVALEKKYDALPMAQYVLTPLFDYWLVLDESFERVFCNLFSAETDYQRGAVLRAVSQDPEKTWLLNKLEDIETVVAEREIEGLSERAHRV